MSCIQPGLLFFQFSQEAALIVCWRMKLAVRFDCLFAHNSGINSMSLTPCLVSLKNFPFLNFYFTCKKEKKKMKTMNISLRFEIMIKANKTQTNAGFEKR